MRKGTRTKSFWGEVIRERVASQVAFISHWTVIEGDYSQAPDLEATWFIDPPYAEAGRLYRHSSKNIDYVALGNWCKTRKGQVIVCENEGATWLPFRFFMATKSTPGSRGKAKSQEVIWTNEG